MKVSRDVVERFPIEFDGFRRSVSDADLGVVEYFDGSILFRVTIEALAALADADLLVALSNTLAEARASGKSGRVLAAVAYVEGEPEIRISTYPPKAAR